jgi:hypothetical protein
VIVAGVGGHRLSSPPPAEPATASSVLSFASTLAGFSITFAGLSSDYSTYYRSDVSAYVQVPGSHRRAAYSIISQVEDVLVLVYRSAGPIRTPLLSDTVEGNADTRTVNRSPCSVWVLQP